MERIERGSVFTALSVKSGETNKGDWELINVAMKGSQQFTIFVENRPCGVKDGDKFTIKDIKAVEVCYKNVTAQKKKLFLEGGKPAWIMSCNIKCDVEPVEYVDPYEEFKVDDEIDWS